MTGTMIDVKIENQGVKDLLAEIQRRTHDLTPAMNIIGQIVRTSIVRNFEKDGRPEEWKKHSKITENRRGKGASILREKNLLVDSIHPRADKNSVVIRTNVKYAATHQFGAEKGSFGTFSITQQVREHIRKIKGKSQKVRTHKLTRKMPVPYGDIPARPFMMMKSKFH